MSEDGKIIAKWVVGVVFALVLVIAVLESEASVDAGNVGVVLQNGGVTGTVLQPGFHLKVPFTQSVIAMNVQIQKDTASLPAGQVAHSSDLQSVTTETVAVNYHLNPRDASKIYQSIGVDYADKVITPAIQDAIKAVTAHYTATNLVVQRDSVQAEMASNIAHKLSKFDINVDAVSITDLTFDSRFNDAIEQKQIAATKVQTAQQNLNQARIDAQVQVVQAQQQADAAVARARGAAQAQVIQANGQAQAQNILLKTLNPLYISWIEAQHWDGKLPQYMSGSLPFLTVPATQK